MYFKKTLLSIYHNLLQLPLNYPETNFKIIRFVYPFTAIYEELLLHEK